jgi:hypothetical protein
MCEPRLWFAAGLGVVCGLVLILIIFTPMFYKPKAAPRRVKRHV